MLIQEIYKLLKTKLQQSRLVRETKTIRVMIHMYCRAHHKTAGELCDECRELADYAELRIQKCRYGAGKPTCVNCPTHCYKPAKRDQVRAVMRYAGPRMLLSHPFLAIMHLLDGRRTAALE
jgi:hypothetical protein